MQDKICLYKPSNWTSAW